VPTRYDGDNAVVLAADWLCFAAAPIFAMMAVLTSAIGGDRSDVLCSVVRDASPLSGMVPMYWLMSAFHLAPWLKLIAKGRSDPRPRGQPAELTARPKTIRTTEQASQHAGQ
jgi:hypothetical protein